jgi:hypothetical protein
MIAFRSSSHLLHTSLRIPGDDHPVTAVANLTTALRLLEDVYATSGDVYGDVVNYCLSYSGGVGSGRRKKEAGFDDEDSQQAVVLMIGPWARAYGLGQAGIFLGPAL